jgi:WD40 repeat protein
VCLIKLKITCLFRLDNLFDFKFLFCHSCTCFSYHVATGSEDNTCRIWDLRSRACLYKIPAHMNLVSQVKYQCQGGNFVVTSSYDNTAKVHRDTGYLMYCYCVYEHSSSSLSPGYNQFHMSTLLSSKVQQYSNTLLKHISWDLINRCSTEKFIKCKNKYTFFDIPSLKLCFPKEVWVYLYFFSINIWYLVLLSA